MQHFHDICVNPTDATDAVSFSAYGPFLPRTGDRLDLEDGTVCQVTRVLFGFSRGGATKFPTYVPNVYAERVGKILVCTAAEQTRGEH